MDDSARGDSRAILDKKLKELSSEPQCTESRSVQIYQNCGRDLKCEINNFLWMLAPEDLTLGELEEIACDLFGKLDRAGQPPVS